MSSENVIKCVAKKLRYYFEVKRLEDGFDLSGTHAPTLSHPPLKPRPTLQYDGLHDRPVKHFFSSPQIRAHITQMDKKFSSELEREKTIRKLVDHYIAQYRFYDKCQSAKYFNTNKPSSLPDCAYIYAKRGKKLRNEGIGFGVSPLSTKHKRIKGGHPLLRRQPPHYISKGEAERLINVATKLLAATETLEDLKSPTVQSTPSSTKTSLPDIDSQKQQTEPPYIRPKTARGRVGQRDLYVYDSNGQRLAASYLNGNQRESNDSAYTTKMDSSASGGWKRKKGWNGNRPRDQWVRPGTGSLSDDSSITDADIGSVPERDRPTSSQDKSPPQGHRVLVPSAIIKDVPAPDQTRVTVLHGQTSESVAIQTDNELLDSFDYMDELVEEGPSCEYQLYVRTGTRIGASTKAEVKVTLYGENGRSKETLLAESKRHKIKFQKGKEDLFIISSPHLGKLRKIKIGHDRTEIAYGWFLEGVSVYDMTDARIYEFICERWLSSHDADRQTYRDLPLDSDRAFIHDNESVTSSTYSINQSEKKADNVEITKDTVSTDSTSMLVKLSKDGDNSSSESETEDSSDSSSSSSSYSSESQRDNGEKELQATDNTTKGVDAEPQGEDVFFDQPPVGPVFTFRSVSSDADTENPEMSESNNAPRSDLSEEQASQYLKGYKDGIEVAHVKEEKQREKLDREKREVLRGEGIHDAARSGDLRRIKDLMYYYPEMASSRDGAGWNPLHISASEGHVDVVKWLLASNVGIDEETPTGYTAVHVAAMNGHVNMLIILCAMGANVNSESVDKQTPLHLASKHGHVESVKWLIANRADISAADTFGRTALDLAQEYDQNDVMDFLESCKAELNDVNSNLAKLRRDQKSISELTTVGDSLSNSHRPHVHFDSNTDKEEHDYDMNATEGRLNADTEIMKEKKVMYDEQQTKMKVTGDSFLDSIRQELYD